MKDEESSSPKHKERVITRRHGMDITNLLEKRSAGEAEHLYEHRKVKSRFSQKENTFVFKQDKISHQPTTKLTVSKDSKENLRSGNEQPLRPINVSKLSLHSIPNIRKQAEKG